MRPIVRVTCLSLFLAGMAYAGTIDESIYDAIKSVSVVAGDPAPDFGAAVRKFSAARHKLALDLSSRLNLPLPDQAETFFRAATTGNWESVSNIFEQVRQQVYDKNNNNRFRNEIWATIHESMGAWEEWTEWKCDSSLLALFHEPVLSSMPTGSIYFGGTDYGRFVITTINALREPPPVFCITQNAVADQSYLAHLRAIYGGSIVIPKQEEAGKAFQRYIDEVNTGKRPKNAEIKIENGRVQVSGALGVMEINGIICEMIFDHNKDSHEFFVEESYVLAWMYPYLEPCGLIMKLNREPLNRLSEEAVARDTQFWSRQERLLAEQSEFAGNEEARKAFSKSRSAIAGLYAYRRMFKESEAAFRQAIRLFPASPEANFRLAQSYEDQGRTAEAVDVMAAFIKRDPPDTRDRVEKYLKQLQDKIRDAGDRTAQ